MIGDARSRSGLKRSKAHSGAGAGGLTQTDPAGLESGTVDRKTETKTETHGTPGLVAEGGTDDAVAAPNRLVRRRQWCDYLRCNDAQPMNSV